MSSSTETPAASDMLSIERSDVNSCRTLESLFAHEKTLQFFEIMNRRRSDENSPSYNSSSSYPLTIDDVKQHAYSAKEAYEYFKELQITVSANTMALLLELLAGAQSHIEERDTLQSSVRAIDTRAFPKGNIV